MGIARLIKDGKLSWDTSSKKVTPLVLEGLEPRILLSGDPLVTTLADPFQNDSLDGQQQVVLHAGFLQRLELVEEQPQCSRTFPRLEHVRAVLCQALPGLVTTQAI